MENDYYNNDNRSLTLRHLQTGCQETLFISDRRAHTENRTSLPIISIAQLAERRSLAGKLTLSCARPAADG